MNMKLALVFVLFATTCSAAQASEQPYPDRRSLPIAPQTFENTVGFTEAESSPGHFIKALNAPDKAPNIVLVMTDDAGFASSSAFGGAAATPTLESLAAEGLRYNQFHTTGVCSPTRAALLTGRNHHTVGMGALVELNSPYSGYTGRIPPNAATIARILRDNGYATAMFGKDHNIPLAERSATGPFDHWPTGRLRGFDYFYGFVSGDTNQWRPSLHENTLAIDDRDRPENYLVDAELTDRAISWLHNKQAAKPEKPFFMYFSYGSPHAPHHAPQDWIARFKGQFDMGWDQLRKDILARQKASGMVPENTELTPRPDMIRAWDSLSQNEQTVYARYMEVFAAQRAYQDAQLGRLLAELERMGLREDTLVVFIEGDNGASGEASTLGTLNEMALLSTGREHDVPIDWLAENLEVLGSGLTYQSYPLGWTWAMNTPFQWFKQLASHLGGVRNGMVVNWPAGIRARGEVRSQFHHVIDIMPTLLEVAGVPAPTEVDGFEQLPIDGISMTYSFDNADEPSHRKTQYFELYGNQGIYHEGWLASTKPEYFPWELTTSRPSSDTRQRSWELYKLTDDFSQSKNLAHAYPDVLTKLKQLFEEEASKYQVFPIHDSGAHARAGQKSLVLRDTKMRATFWGSGVRLDFGNAPPMFHLPFSITAQVEIGEQTNGVIFAAGSSFGGWSFYLMDNKPVIMASVSPLPGGSTRLASPRSLEPGSHTLNYSFTPEGLGGTVSLTVDGLPFLEGQITERPKMLAGNGESLNSGHDANDPVSMDYQNEGYFTGLIQKIVLETQRPAMASQAKG